MKEIKIKISCLKKNRNEVKKVQNVNIITPQKKRAEKTSVKCNLKIILFVLF